MQNANDVECLYVMIQLKKRLKAVDQHPKKNQEFKRKLGLDTDRVTCDEQEVIGTLKNVFEGEIILNQFNVNS